MGKGLVLRDSRFGWYEDGSEITLEERLILTQAASAAGPRCVLLKHYATSSHRGDGLLDASAKRGGGWKAVSLSLNNRDAEDLIDPANVSVAGELLLECVGRTIM